MGLALKIQLFHYRIQPLVSALMLITRKLDHRQPLQILNPSALIRTNKVFLRISVNYV